jgi:lysophospholipase L1-like esterase
MRTHLIKIGLVFFGLLLSFPGLAGATDPDPTRFEHEIAIFEAWDHQNSFPERANLFVGSSSIRFWHTANAFPGKPVINRGFGGSEISDVIYYYDQVIKPYAPAKIFLYAGDNDIADGKSPEQVFEDYVELAAKVRADFPDTELIFLSIKPSDARWKKWPKMAQANQLIREFTASDPKLGYVDVASLLLGDDGRPKDVYVMDGLHLNDEGYRLWNQALAPLLVD